MTALARQTHADRFAPDRLTGRQKAAIICAAIGAEHAAKLTAALNAEEADIIALEMAQLEQVPTTTTDSVLMEWLELTVGLDSFSSGGVEFAKEVLEKAFGSNKAQAILKRIQGQIANSDRFGRLRRADPQQLSSTLRGEHPQTIALILAHLEEDRDEGGQDREDGDNLGDVIDALKRHSAAVAVAGVERRNSSSIIAFHAGRRSKYGWTRASSII